MKPNEPDEPGSDDYNARLWRRVRNEKVLNQTQPLKAMAGTSRWEIPTGFFNNGSQPIKMCFHQFEEHLAIADDRDSIWYAPHLFEWLYCLSFLVYGTGSRVLD